MFVAPTHQGHDRTEQVEPGVSKPIFVALGIPGVRNPLEKARVDKHPQPGRERGPRNVEVARELTEAPHTVERFAQDEQRPSLADQFKGPADRLTFEAVG